MQHRDEFDGPGGLPDFRNAVSSIFRALDRRDRIEPRRPVWAVAIVGTLVVFLGCVLWYSYPREKEKGEMQAAPIIRADAGPYKVVPSDPGGMDIPHRDSTVFETLRADAGADTESRHVENLLDDPEQPVDRDQFFSGLKTELRVEGHEVIAAPEDGHEAAAPARIASAAPAPAVVDITEGAPVAAAPEKPAAAASVSSALPTPRAKPEKQIAEEVSRTEPAAGVETFEKSGSGWYVQLASLRSSDAATAMWKDLQKSMTVLKPLDYKVEKADLGAKGTYYRLKTGPYSEAKARQICASVTAQKPGGCLVVHD